MISKVCIPDLGSMSSAEVVEILVNVGDVIVSDQPVLVLEGEKATVEVPSSGAGIVKKILCKIGDKLISGQEIIDIQVKESKEEDIKSDKVEQKDLTPITKILDITLPDVGAATGISVIDVAIQVGSKINLDDPIVTLETEKASMDVPSPYAGTIVEVIAGVGDELSQGSLIARIESSVDVVEDIKEKKEIPEKDNQMQPIARNTDGDITSDASVHATPSVRRTAREFGVDLSKVTPTGRKGRIVVEDVQNYVKKKLQSGGGISLPEQVKVDFEKFGEIETVSLNKIKQFTAKHVHSSWLRIPHVTHFDEADISEMDTFRKSENKNLSSKGIKLTPLAFIMKAVVKCLQDFPNFNSSLSHTGKELIIKKYYHIGIAVDTPKGLVVPVIKDVDQKNIEELSIELGAISQQAREKGLSVSEMQGNTFTISSLGGIGGVGFTPIVNSPDVAIMGVSKAKIQPVYINDEFVPKLVMPYSISYDHRVIDGAEAARFSKQLSTMLTNIIDIVK